MNSVNESRDIQSFHNLSYENDSVHVTSGYFQNPFHNSTVKACFIACYVLVFGTCIIGNSLVLLAIMKCHRLRSMTNFFLTNLAVADICIGLFCILPNLSTFLSQNWILGRVMCKVYYYVWNVSYTASIVILTVVAVERYIAITYPLKARHVRTRRKLFVACIIIWLTAIVYNIPYLIFYDIILVESETVEFCYFYQEHERGLKGLSLANLVVWYLLPLVVIAVMYCKVGTRLCNRSFVPRVRHHKRNAIIGNQSQSCDSNVEIIEENMFTKPSVQCNEGQNQETKYSLTSGSMKNVRTSKLWLNSIRLSRTSTFDGDNDSSDRKLEVTTSLRKLNYERRKVIRLLVAIVVSFAFCVLPHQLKVFNYFWNVVDLPHAVDVYFSPISFIMLYLNSLLNPILYALFSANFRKAVKTSLSCCGKANAACLHA